VAGKQRMFLFSVKVHKNNIPVPLVLRKDVSGTTKRDK